MTTWQLDQLITCKWANNRGVHDRHSLRAAVLKHLQPYFYKNKMQNRKIQQTEIGNTSTRMYKQNAWKCEQTLKGSLRALPQTLPASDVQKWSSCEKLDCVSPVLTFWMTVTAITSTNTGKYNKTNKQKYKQQNTYLMIMLWKTWLHVTIVDILNDCQSNNRESSVLVSRVHSFPQASCLQNFYVCENHVNQTYHFLTLFLYIFVFGEKNAPVPKAITESKMLSCQFLMST